MAIDETILDFVVGRNVGSLATLKRDGRPQLSNVSYTFDPTAGPFGIVRMSLTDSRAKVKNLRRDPRASMLVSSSDGWTYAVLEGDVTLTAVAADPDDSTVDELVEIYRAIAGKEHPDWAEFRQAMVDDKRLVGRLNVTHGYGLPVR
jgi:PPOX class probable F420-dependent enzyme